MYILDRHVAEEKEMVFHTYEMIAWLQSKSGASEDMLDALIGAWVGIVNYEVLSRYEENPKILESIKKGEGLFYLDSELVPDGWDNDSLFTQIYHEIGSHSTEVRPLLQLMAEKLRELDEKRAFEPIGWLKSKKHKFLIYFWEDFLDPQSREPANLEEEEQAAKALILCSVPPINIPVSYPPVNVQTGRFWHDWLRLKPRFLFRRS